MERKLSAFAHVQSLSIPSSWAWLKWNQIAIQISDPRANSSPGKTQTHPCEKVCSLHYVSIKTDAEVDEGTPTLGLLVENDLRRPCSRSSQHLINVQSPYFQSAGGSDSLSPSKGTFFPCQRMKVTFSALDYKEHVSTTKGQSSSLSLHV